jgi:predicted DsbA family dithiol-disulfide isomerase
MKNINIKIVSDIVCPWCYIGKARLDKAIKASPDINVEIEWIPFQLNPDVPEEGIKLFDYLEGKFGSEERIEEMYNRLTAVAHQEGVTINYNKEQFLPNTLKAHYLIQNAPTIALRSKIKESLMHAFFTENVRIDDDLLKKVADEYELDVNWDSFPETKQTLLKKEQIYKSQGINAVPSFIINNQYLVQGAQPAETFINAFNQLTSDLNSVDENSTESDSCSIDDKNC